MAGGLTGLKDQGVEDASERTKDTGTTTPKTLMRKREGYFMTTLRRVEDCLIKWHDSQWLVGRDGEVVVSIRALGSLESADSFPLLPRHVEECAEVEYLSEASLLHRKWRLKVV